MEKFLTIILFVFAGFWLMGIVGRWLLRYWIQKKQREFMEQFGGDPGAAAGGAFGGKGFGGFYTTFGGAPGAGRKAPEPAEGEVTITRPVKPDAGVSKEIGEYVEFEEIDTAGN